jgi:hypothetical protein
MTGPVQPSGIVQIEPQEAATGTVKTVWLPQIGSVHVPVAPGTVDGAMVWVQPAAGPLVLVTIRVGPAKKRLTTGQQVLAYGVGVVLLAGCCAGGGVLAFRDGAKDDKKSAAPVTAVRSGPPPDAAPVAPADYVTLLAASDTAIATDFKRLATNDPKALAAAAPQVAQTIRDQATRLLAVKAPAGATQQHAALVAELEGFADDVETVATDPPKAACPAAATSAYVSLLGSDTAGLVHGASQQLAAADRTFVFGRFLPVAPKIATTRPANGSFVKKAGKHGTGKLKIKNGGSDATVSLVPTKGAKKPIFTVYVRGKSNYTVTRVGAGTYWLYYSSGSGWNPKRKGFTDNCDFSRFDDKFPFKGYPIIDTWQVTMTPVAGGNATTSDVDPGQFPSG